MTKETKAVATRIYRVTDSKANPAASYLDEATNQAHALRIVTAPRFTVDVPNGQTLSDPFSGNLADVCPVGSLTTREFRFKSRPWEMTAVESTCTACSLGCSNTLWSKRGVMQRMTARPPPGLHPNRGARPRSRRRASGIFLPAAW